MSDFFTQYLDCNLALMVTISKKSHQGHGYGLGQDLNKIMFLDLRHGSGPGDRD